MFIAKKIIKMAANEGVSMLEDRIQALEKRIISSNPEKIKTSVCFFAIFKLCGVFWGFFNTLTRVKQHVLI